MRLQQLANRRTRVARAERGNPADLMLLLYSQKPRQRATLARTVSPTVPATEARVRAEAKITSAGAQGERKGQVQIQIIVTEEG